jgi:ABC-type phosphate/phosphonate transport system substrate-binding protein
MNDRIASLPMYDFDRDAVEAWWRGIALALQAEGVSGVPSALEWPDELNAHWRDSRLQLSQTCGYPLVTTLMGDVQVVGAFCYTAPGCFGIQYRSELIARIDDGSAIEDFRGRRAVVNSFDSHSGANALQGLVAPLADEGGFFSHWSASGSHRRSIEAVRSGSADVAAIDCVTLEGLRRHAPASMLGLRVIGSTAAAPGLPLVTAASTTAAHLQALRRALLSACGDPALAEVREALLIGGFEIVDVAAWQVIEEVRRYSTGAQDRRRAGTSPDW